ncbi:hypothetical protein [Sporomusa termitida]|uniref:Uncharacterized protein n=1 Tax=Sporomusa termitida TaxID=2377 RepID=A0A517DXF8_9FIRM|nr:hypothetical protein [Sporomusa termitida]QDR82013.1 hypothetical protein SPTER_34340 [Sporomusa termitida]
MEKIYSPEVHLFIVWEKARYKEKIILDEIRENFKVLGVYNIIWSKDKISENFSRFYGRKLPANSNKEKHCGTGPFLLVVIEDSSPHYIERKTSKGDEVVNKNTFDLKSKYRDMTGGGHKIHCTNSKEETDHDLTLLLGLNASDFLNNSSIHLGEVVTLNRDITGSDGWKDINEFFYVLNNTVKYVILRNFECLPDQYKIENHGDIDLLVDNLKEFEWISNGIKLSRKKHRVQYHINVGKEKILLDSRYLGDNYYDSNWEKNILNNRIVNKNLFYTPNVVDYFYSLLYHALIHKRRVSEDYIKKIGELFECINNKSTNIKMFADEQQMMNLLDSFMKSNEYEYTEPVDLSVYYNNKRVKQSITNKRLFNEKIVKRVQTLINKMS